jgi:hypothetical protein
VERAADTSIGVEESNKFGALEMRNILVVVVELEKNLEGGSVANGLELAPETALVAANAIHKATDVAETVAEVLLQGWALAVSEHEALIEDLGNTGSFLGNLKNLGAGSFILGSIAHAKLVLLLLQIRTEFGNGTGHEGVVEVDVSNAIGELVQTMFVARQVRVPLASSLVKEVPAQVSADTGVHSRHDTVKDTLLKALIVDLETGVGDKGSVGILLATLL